MNSRTIITIVLVAFIAVSVAYLIAHESRSGDREAATGAAVEETQHRVIVYYFHGDKRCRTCLSIEAYTREAIEEGFPRQLELGELELHVVNVDEPEHGHFIEDYKLTTRSVVLSDYRSGAEERWKNLNLVWEYVRDKEAFIDYIRSETEDYLGESSYE